MTGATRSAAERLLPLACGVLVLDVVTKRWAEQTLPLHEPMRIAGDVFRLTLGYNTGAVFGVFASGGQVLLVVTGAAVLGLLTWMLTVLSYGHLPAPPWPIGLILGGAAANFLDRLPDGQVTDFLDAGLGPARWPTFNLADTAIVTGIAVVLLTSVAWRRPVGSAI